MTTVFIILISLASIILFSFVAAFVFALTHPDAEFALDRLATRATRAREAFEACHDQPCPGGVDGCERCRDKEDAYQQEMDVHWKVVGQLILLLPAALVFYYGPRAAPWLLRGSGQ